MSEILERTHKEIRTLDQNIFDEVSLTHDNLDLMSLINRARSPSAGAVANFCGTTRDTFDGKEVVQLEYEGYPEMALPSMLEICSKAREKWSLLNIVIQHKLGACPISEMSVAVIITSVHRKDSLDALGFAIDELKRTVPIWKKEFYGDGQTAWKDNVKDQALADRPSANGEEIVTLLDSVFTDRNVVSHLDEVGITLDASLPQVINMEGKLGIAKTALKPIFVYAIPKLFSLLHSDSSTHNMGVECHKQLISVSRAVLLVKGDFPAAFNCRKLAIENGKLEVIDEIQFTALLFTLHPKCPSGWHHRRWCLARKFNVRVNMFTASIQEISTISKTLSAGVIETERVLCSNMAEKHPKNYYAWLHRLWLLQFMKHHQLCDELQFTREWLFAHVSDHSAVNHRIQVIRRIMLCDEAQNILLRECNSTVTADVKFCRWVLENCEEDDSDRCSHNLKGENRENRKQGEHVCTVITGILKKFLVLDHLLNDCEALIRDRPGHQSLWCLRRMLLEMLFETVKAEFGSSILPSVGDISFDRSSLEKLFSFTNDNIAAPNAATTTTTTIAAGTTTTTTAAAALATNIAGVAWSIAEPAWISMDVRFSLLHGALLVPATAATPVTATSNGKLLQQVSRGDSADTMVPLSPQVLSEWLVALLIQELRIVHFCSTDTSNWDPIVQSRMALRYGAFLIERVGILIHTCIDPKRNDPFLIHEPMKANSSWDCIISKLSRQFQDI